MNTLDPQAVLADYQGRKSARYKAYPRYVWQHDGWHITFGAMPLRLHGRTIAIEGPASAHVVDYKTGLLTALGKKHGRYGALTHPLVIAVLDGGADPGEPPAWDDPLFGTLTSEWDEATLEPIGDIRTSDGYWCAADGRHGNVAAVVGLWALRPSEVVKRAPSVWQNPYASTSVGGHFPWSIRSLDGTAISVRPPATDPTTLFGLPIDWPD